MPQPSGALTLSPPDRLLILAALGDREIAQSAWDAWQRCATLDDIEPAGFAVLPAVSRNLDRLEVEHALATRMRGVYRYAWSHSQLTFRDLSHVHRTLAAGGVRAVAHRGLPVVVRYVGDVAAIISDQIDLLIPGVDLERATEMLVALGWNPAGPVPPSAIRSAFAAHTFEGVSRRRVVVHWRSFPLGCSTNRELDLIGRATDYPVQGVDLLLPDPTDQLVLACLRLRTLADVERVRWTVETCAILQDSEGRLDECAFAERAAGAGVLNECAESLEAIHTLVHQQLPSVRSLRLPHSGVGGAPGANAHGAPRNQVQRVVRAAKKAVRRYAAVCRSNGATSTPWGFVRFTAAFYRHEWGVRNARGLAGAAVRRLRGGTETFVPRAP